MLERVHLKGLILFRAPLPPAATTGPILSTDLADQADSVLVGCMRLLLAATALLATIIEARPLEDISLPTRIVLWGYFLHAMLVIGYALLRRNIARSRHVHRLDVVWYAVICMVTGGVYSPFFLYFFFAILTCSVRLGFDEGVRITMASVALFVAGGLVTGSAQDMTGLLLRGTFLLTLGCLCVFWGGSKWEVRRRLALLREVSQMSNPRFGVDRTVDCALEKVRDFFQGQACVLVMQDGDNASCTLHTARQGELPHSGSAQLLDRVAAEPFLSLLEHYIASYCCVGWGRHVFSRRMMVRRAATDRWVPVETAPGWKLADLLEARAFISVPIDMRRGEGRIFVLRSDGKFSRSDALFLNQVVLQAFAVIETIRTIDRMASEAASTERHRLSRNLHDAAVQPYIGLQMALGAIRIKAGSVNPVSEELDRLIATSARVITDLRCYAAKASAGQHMSEHMLACALERQARQMLEFHGVDISVQVQPDMCLNDRLAAEIVQFSREGMSNICRHTLAQRGSVHISIKKGQLCIAVRNEGTAGAPGAIPFRPGSLTGRAEALGGTLRVEQELDGGSTTVWIEIPL